MNENAFYTPHSKDWRGHKGGKCIVIISQNKFVSQVASPVGGRVRESQKEE
jgi:glycine cleavage system H lipoate-binding protein